MISASHLAPTIHIRVVIISMYLERVQFDEKRIQFMLVTYITKRRILLLSLL